MSSAPKAQPCTLEEARKHGWVFFSHASTLGDPVPIHAMHSSFFECHDGRPLNEPPRRYGKGPHPPVHVTKNIYNLTPVFKYRSGLVVNEPIRDMLTDQCICEFQEVVIDHAFWFPYAPGDSSYEMALVNVEGREEDVIQRFADAYKYKPTDEKYYYVVAPSAYLLKDRFADVHDLHVGWDQPNNSGAYGRDVTVSKSMTDEYGLVIDRGYMCRPDVFEMLNPYLHRPWFWAQPYLY